MGKTLEKINVKIYTGEIRRKPWGKNKRTMRRKKNHEKNTMKVLELLSLDMSLLEMFLQGHPCYQSEKKNRKC